MARRFSQRIAAMAVVGLLGCVLFFSLTNADPQPAEKSGGSLSDDGRVGKIVDVQGLVAVRAAGARRWTPVCGTLPVQPGDWIRTDARGANAVKIALAKAAAVIVGPDSIVEVVGAEEVKLHSGEVQVTPGKGGKVKLVGPDGKAVEVAEAKLFRATERGTERTLAVVEKKPLWLAGFEGAIPQDSIGSLVAKVDGRDVPLTVGYHKVTVDIRDQIARTVIEESFVNLTNGTLEGVFFFPLPQDASISGFGMWIGEELVEADVVEKQRAREIYETILREKRDPGLLEWSGGNLFKARVFPIFPHSEKRIKITYTQVLPLKGTGYRYSYALQSEMLRQHPLRDLNIDVQVHSAIPLKSIACLSHPARTTAAAHSGRVEFSAQEYSPTRDFEVAIEIDGSGQPVTMIPHRRGDDGYFLLQLTPPGADGGWQRELVPDGEPLRLLILADTSASLADSSRATQAEFIAALLSSLDEKDQFNLAVSDVECDWLFPESQPVTAARVQQVRDTLAARVSLGWSDLDKAFSSALKRAAPGTQVIYVGDATPATHDADPVAFAQRLKRMTEGRPGTFHAVAVSSTFEPLVLKAIAAHGGGSARRIGGEVTPSSAAMQLLAEIARPGLRDLKVEFRGVRVARVYPETLPNLPAGTQQLLLGRYLPEGTDQRGEVIVTGRQGDQAVRFSAPIVLKDAESGNEFIPRLWARMHLDQLLEQGSSPPIVEEIIGLSEEYHIITPYTSLLVLESDADRERFKVKRRFQMRDGERFFAVGRQNADYELAQQQMRLASNWRKGLRRLALREFSLLGRDPSLFEPQSMTPYSLGRYGGLGGMGGGFGGGGGHWDFAYASGGAMPASGPMGNMSGLSDRLEMLNDESGVEVLGLELNEPASSDWDSKDGDVQKAEAEYQSDERMATSPDGDFESDQSKEAFDIGPSEPMFEGFAGKKSESLGGEYFQRRKSVRSVGQRGASLAGVFRDRLIGGPMAASKPYGRNNAYDYGYVDPFSAWLGNLFPALPGSSAEPEPYETKWSPEARKLAESLLRTAKLAKLDGGLEIARVNEAFDPRFDRRTMRSFDWELVSPGRWLIRNSGAGSSLQLNWCDGKQRGVFSTAFELGRVRESTPRDLSEPPLALNDFSLTSLERSFPLYVSTLEAAGENQTRLTVKPSADSRDETQYLIDTRRNVVLEVRYLLNGKLQTRTAFSEFVEVAGCWWATKIEIFDEENRRTSLVTQSVKLLAAEAFESRFAAESAKRSQVQFIREPLPELAAAKNVLAAGKAGFDDRLVLALHFFGSQQWDRVFEHFQAAEKLALENQPAGKPGLRWMRDALLANSRRQEELRLRILETAGRLPKLLPAAPPAAAYARTSDAQRQFESRLADINFVANHLVQQAAGTLAAHEMLPLLDVLKPVYDAQPAHTSAEIYWLQQRVSYLSQAGQRDAAMALWKQIAEKFPQDYSAQQQYAQQLFNAGEHDAAFEWLDRTLANESAKWHDHEAASLRNTYLNLLRQQARYDRMVDVLRVWLKPEKHPADSTFLASFLSALVMSGQEDEANATLAQWLKEGRTEKPLPDADAARIGAAINQALGQGYYLYTNTIDPRWLDPLAETALFFTGHETHSHLASNILGNWRFQNSDAARGVRKQLLQRLIDGAGTLPPSRVSNYVSWVSVNDPPIEKPTWKKIADMLRRRWEAEKDDDKKHSLAGPLLQILQSQFAGEPTLEFLRKQRTTGPKAYREHYAAQLFDSLLAQPWQAAYEDEAFALLTKMSADKDAAQRLLNEVRQLHRLTDAMIAARQAALDATIEHKEKLTRTELAKLQRDHAKAARTEFAKRLRAEVAKQEPPLAKWLNVERRHLEVLREIDLAKAAEECWEVLGNEPPLAAKQPAAEQAASQLLDEALRHRYTILMCHLAARHKADAKLVERWLAYLQTGADRKPAAAADDPSAADRHAADREYWRALLFQMLVALDRPKELETALRSWLPAATPQNQWRLALGQLLAEQGRLAEAIQLYEAVKAADELSPSDLRRLAGWYIAVDRRVDYEQATIAMYKTVEEYQLSNAIRQRLYPWQQSDGHLPSELDPEILLMFRALFEKSESPSNYVWQLREFYTACRDFRLLSMVPDAVVGRSAGSVYPFLRELRPLLDEVRDEATADAIVERIAAVRKRLEMSKEKPAAVVDLRALYLLEMLVERRAANLQNQPGPHATNALAALSRAFTGTWSAGEPRLMADLLASLGNVPDAGIAQLQLIQLETLHRQEKDAFDRLHIAAAWASTLWAYAKFADASDRLTAAFAEYQADHSDLPPHLISQLSDYLEAQGQFAAGEKMLADQIARAANLQNRHAIIIRRFQLYENALNQDAAVSLGSGQTLYQATQKRLLESLDTNDHSHRYQLVERLLSLYRTASRVEQVKGVQDDLRAFAKGRVNDVLKRQTDNYTSIVSNVAETLRDLCGPRDGLAFLIDQIEREPAWFRLNNQDGWNQHGWRLAQWRNEVGAGLGDLEPRLLKLVLAELRRDLETQSNRDRGIYRINSGYFWKEHASDFLRTANELLKEKGKSSSSVIHIAAYVFHSLHQYDRAIEMLKIAHRDRVLDEGGQSMLVDYLHERDRHAEAIAILRALVELRPDYLPHRTRLMHAFFRTNNQPALLELLAQTDKHFRDAARWDEAAMWQLASSCLENQLYAQSIDYFDELIPLHQRTQPNRGIGNGTLSNYYTSLAHAHSGLQHTAEAVDAASAAIVAWGPRHAQRQSAVETLRAVLRASKDLDAFVAKLDKQAADSGLENPIVRKALGQVYRERENYPAAIIQLKLALESQPNDAETHDALIACHDSAGDSAAAARQLLASLQLLRRDFARYASLADRWQTDPAAAERALTSIVEVLPNESESHQKLAELRESQNRWPEAIQHWHRVAAIRSLEPTGLLALAKAQAHQTDWPAVTLTLKQLRARPWPNRFSNTEHEIRELERQLSQANAARP